MRFKDWATREIETTELIRRIKTFIVREKMTAIIWRTDTE